MYNIYVHILYYIILYYIPHHIYTMAHKYLCALGMYLYLFIFAYNTYNYSLAELVGTQVEGGGGPHCPHGHS